MDTGRTVKDETPSLSLPMAAQLLDNIQQKSNAGFLSILRTHRCACSFHLPGMLDQMAVCTLQFNPIEPQRGSRSVRPDETFDKTGISDVARARGFQQALA